MEPWLELSPGPAMSEWQIQNGAFGLSSADLVSLDLRPKASSIEDGALSADFRLRRSPALNPSPCLPGRRTRQGRWRARNRLPAGRCGRHRHRARSNRLNCGPSSVQASSSNKASVRPDLPLWSVAQFADSQLLELPPTVINFPAEDSDVGLWLAATQNRRRLLPPRRRRPERRRETTAPGHRSKRCPVYIRNWSNKKRRESRKPLRAAQHRPSQRNLWKCRSKWSPRRVPATSGAVPEDGPETPAAEEPRPKFATELFEISIRMFTPAKAGADRRRRHSPARCAPLLPHLKSLPLRPKMAMASGYVPPSKASALPETKAGCARRNRCAYAGSTEGARPRQAGRSPDTTQATRASHQTGAAPRREARRAANSGCPEDGAPESGCTEASGQAGGLATHARSRSRCCGILRALPGRARERAPAMTEPAKSQPRRMPKPAADAAKPAANRQSRPWITEAGGLTSQAIK